MNGAKGFGEAEDGEGAGARVRARPCFRSLDPDPAPSQTADLEHDSLWGQVAGPDPPRRIEVSVAFRSAKGSPDVLSRSERRRCGRRDRRRTVRLRIPEFGLLGTVPLILILISAPLRLPRTPDPKPPTPNAQHPGH